VLQVERADRAPDTGPSFILLSEGSLKHLNLPFLHSSASLRDPKEVLTAKFVSGTSYGQYVICGRVELWRHWSGSEPTPA
jgi:hypothetical protein